MNDLSRREFIKRSAYTGAGAFLALPFNKVLAEEVAGSRMKFGLVTYLWGRDWTLPVLIANCQKAGVFGVELRTEHAHGVESNLTAAQRADVKKQFADSTVTLVGLGTNFSFHYVDQTQLKKDIEGAKEYIKLSSDVGGSGVKVKPNDLPGEVPREKTIEQIGRSLNILGAFGADYGQQLRLEVHGQCAELTTIKAIMNVADHPNVTVCWNSNDEDLKGGGLEYNFNLVKDRFGDTVHIRELGIGDYPYQQLIELLVKMDYGGWVLLEARTEPQDRVKALAEQKRLWDEMLVKAQQAVAAGAVSDGQKGVKITELEKKLRVEIDGKLFTEYNFKDVPRPFFYPVIGPTGVNITRHWPMEEGKDEEHDHPHHRSLWYGHGDINKNDFWGEEGNFGKIVHEKFIEVSGGDEAGIIKSANKYVTAEGKVVCTDIRTHRIYRLAEAGMIDFEIAIFASQGEVVFGDTKEGSMAIRLAPTIQLTGKAGRGHIINSEGVRDGQTWGKRAAWCDYYGPLEGQVVGVAIFDHPSNPRHPTWWHVRDYGLFAANPFGVHYFEGKPEGTGNIVIPAGENLTFRYRFYFHKGDEKQAKVVERYREYAG